MKQCQSLAKNIDWKVLWPALGKCVKWLRSCWASRCRPLWPYDYQLAQAGLRTTGGRGRSAAKMTTRDAAALLIVLWRIPPSKTRLPLSLATRCYGLNQESSGRTKILGPLVRKESKKAWDLRFLPPNPMSLLGNNHTFLQFLAALIEFAKDLRPKAGNQPTAGLLVPSLSITTTSPWIGARVAVETANFGESRTYNVKGTKAGYVGPTGVDLLSSYTISNPTIDAVSRCLNDEPVVTTPLSSKIGGGCDGAPSN